VPGVLADEEKGPASSDAKKDATGAVMAVGQPQLPGPQPLKQYRLDPFVIS
jgi:hypothetical protein